METIKLLHRLDSDEQIIELREYVTMLSYEYDLASDKHRDLILEIRPVLFLTILMLMELGEWGPEATPIDEILEEYQEKLTTNLGDRMTPGVRDALDRVVSALVDMIETCWAPIKREEVDAMVDERVPYSDTVRYTVIKYDVDVNPVTYIMSITPTLMEEAVQKH